ncbi:MAG TPA: 30S ribosomal protein S6 [Dehalococcoidia bacterium]|nr:30S ribosomal protein S6 [Dehalococcoidia bacterium]
MRNYELTVVFSPEIAEEDVDTAIERVNQFITQKEGVIIEVKRWGRRKLAYPIENFRDGNYVLTQLKLQPSQAKELEANLRSREDVLRYLLVRLEE